jgi:hypothetical protein
MKSKIFASIFVGVFYMLLVAIIYFFIRGKFSLDFFYLPEYNIIRVCLLLIFVFTGSGFLFVETIFGSVKSKVNKKEFKNGNRF